MKQIRKKILWIYLTGILIGLGYLLWLRITGIGISCYIREATGLLCPGCGISRMFLAMLRLDFTAAFAYNPVAFCLFFFWNGVAMLCFLGKPALVQKSHFLYGSLWCSVGALVVYGILRNLI